MMPTPPYPHYTAFFAELKERIESARIAAGRSVNRELVMLYWDVGRRILDKQKAEGWGEAVVIRLAADLRVEFPNVRGFSNANVWRMLQLYSDYTSPEFLSQVVRQSTKLPGNLLLVQAVKGIPPDQILEQPVPEVLSQAVRELLWIGGTS